jgi:hypothetical protein
MEQGSNRIVAQMEAKTAACQGEGAGLETHYTVQEIAARWKLSVHRITRGLEIAA